MKKLFLLMLFFLGCSPKTEDLLVCMQINDRNGFSETITSQERLLGYKDTNFFSNQPYKKVIRIFETSSSQKRSKITSYHQNGMIAEYLEALDGRAFGKYKKWYENGKLKVDANIIEGPCDLSYFSQKEWIFDKKCLAYDKKGNLISLFNYSKGKLHGKSLYYFSDGRIKKIEPYIFGKKHGEALTFNENGEIIKKSYFENGLKEKKSYTYFSKDIPLSIENYEKGKLAEGVYFSKEGTQIAKIVGFEGKRAIFKKGILQKMVEYKKGEPFGTTDIFLKGKLHRSYQVERGKKNGRETVYYLDEKTPRLIIHWADGNIHGKVKTYYQNGNKESEKEFSQNKKNGIASSWYMDGVLMFVEEYVDDVLKKGVYYKKDQKKPISTITKGTGTATLFSKDGTFLRSIKYVEGAPLDEKEF